MPSKVIEQYTIQKERKIWMTLQQSQMNIFDYTEDDATSLPLDFLAKASVSLAKERVLKIQGDQFSLILQGQLKKSNHLMFSWKSSKAYSLTMRDRLTEQSFKRWTKW